MPRSMKSGSNTPDWANLNVDDLLYEWTQTDEMGWARELSAAEANVILGALYDARQELAEHPRRCDEPSPDGSLMCDAMPSHDGKHVNAEGYEWSETRA